MRRYYGVPEGDTPVSPYEARKVRELAERIRSPDPQVHTSDVHIIAGRKIEQVRRIAYLTARSLKGSGARIIPVEDEIDPDRDETEGTDYSVFLVDETSITDRPDGEGGDQAERPTARSLVDSIRKASGKRHSFLVSLTQDTYERDFRVEAESPSAEAVEARKPTVTKQSGEADQEVSSLGKYWPAFLPAAASFAMAPVFALNLYSNSGALDAGWLLASLVLTAITLVMATAAALRLNGHSRYVVFAGTGIFLVEIVVPFVMMSTGTLPGTQLVFQGASTSPFYYHQQLYDFIVFQSIAAAAFVIIAFPYSGWSGRFGLLSAFFLSEGFILVFALSNWQLLPYSVNLPEAVFLQLPVSAPFNTILFGFVYHMESSGDILSLTLSMASQWVFALIYLGISMGQRRIRLDSTLREGSGMSIT